MRQRRRQTDKLWEETKWGHLFSGILISCHFSIFIKQTNRRRELDSTNKHFQRKTAMKRNTSEWVFIFWRKTSLSKNLRLNMCYVLTFHLVKKIISYPCNLRLWPVTSRTWNMSNSSFSFQRFGDFHFKTVAGGLSRSLIRRRIGFLIEHIKKRRSLKIPIKSTRCVTHKSKREYGSLMFAFATLAFVNSRRFSAKHPPLDFMTDGFIKKLSTLKMAINSSRFLGFNFRWALQEGLWRESQFWHKAKRAVALITLISI